MGSIFYDPKSSTKKYARNMPHWSQTGKCYFVTFRLADSLPVNTLNELKIRRNKWLSQTNLSPRDIAIKRVLFSRRMDKLLDAGNGECVLNDLICKNILADSLRFFDGVRYLLDYCVIMPNHVHLIMVVCENWDLNAILHSIKSYSSNKINEHLNRQGRLWQDETFDHIVRSERHLNKFRKYIIKNAEQSKYSLLLKGTFVLE